MYGTKCYRKNPDHLKKFYHPPREADKEQEEGDDEKEEVQDDLDNTQEMDPNTFELDNRSSGNDDDDDFDNTQQMDPDSYELNSSKSQGSDLDTTQEMDPDSYLSNPDKTLEEKQVNDSDEGTEDMSDAEITEFTKAEAQDEEEEEASIMTTTTSSKNNNKRENTDSITQTDGSLPLCKYGAACYRMNTQHLAAFRHPTSNTKNSSVPPAKRPKLD